MSLFTSLFSRKAPPAKVAEVDNQPATQSETGVITGARPLASTAQSGGYTPDRVADVLAAVESGDEYSLATFWRLADYVMEREPHASALINSLALAVAGLIHRAEPARGDKSKRARKLADEVTAFMEPGTPLRLAARGLLSKGISHGLGGSAVVWDTSVTPWVPSAVVQKPNHFYTFDRRDGQTPLLRSAVAGGLPGPLEPGLSLVYTPRRMDAMQVKNSLAWVLCWIYAIKAIVLARESAFVEAFGSPIIYGTFGKNATPKDVSMLRSAVNQLSAMARGVFREDLQVKFESVAKSGTDMYENLLRYLDELTSKVVLGSTLTTDAGGSGTYALGKVHAEGKYDVVRGYAGQWAAALQTLAHAYVVWNYGPGAPVPRVVVDVEEAEDLVASSQIVKNLTDAGVTLDAQEVRERFGFRSPDEGAETIGGGGGAAPAPLVPDQPSGASASQAMQGGGGCPVHAQRASTSAQASSASSRLDELDRLADEMLADYATASSALDEFLAKAAASVDDPADLPAALQAAIQALDGRELQALFASARTKAITGGLAGGSV